MMQFLCDKPPKKFSMRNTQITPDDVEPTKWTHGIEPIRGDSEDDFSHKIRQLYHCIVQDDQEKLRDVLDEFGDEEERVRVLNSRYSYLNSSTDSCSKSCVWDCERMTDQMAVTYPVSCAAVYASENCFRALIEAGADIFIQDAHDNNLVHLLVYTNTIKPACVIERMYDTLLSRVSSHSKRRELLFHKSADGLNPLELAAKHLCTEMFSHILYTEGVYREVISHQGRSITNKFTFPDTAYKDRDVFTSFMWQLTWIEETAASSLAVNKILNIPIIDKLIKHRFMKALPVIIVWCLLRCAVGLVFFAVDFNLDASYRNYSCFPNATSKPIEMVDPPFIDLVFQTWSIPFSEMPPEFLMQVVYQTGYGFITVFYDLMESIYLRQNTTIFKKGGAGKLLTNGFVNSGSYRVVMFLFALHALAINGLTLWVRLDPVGTESFSESLAPSLYLSLRILVVFGILYFVQLMPFVGYFTIGFQKMLSTVSKFAVLQLVIIYLFASLFKHVSVYFCRTSVFGCEADSGLYQTFLIMINMVPEVVPRAAGACTELGLSLMAVLHVMYVFIVAVMTINYLIAVMSSVYNMFTYHQDSAVTLHRVHAFLVVERQYRMLRYFLPCFGKCQLSSTVLIVTEVDHDFDKMRHLRVDNHSSMIYRENTDSGTTVTSLQSLE